MVGEDPEAEVAEQRPVRVGLDVRARRLLGFEEPDEAAELREVAAAERDDADDGRERDRADGGEPPGGQRAEQDGDRDDQRRRRDEPQGSPDGTGEDEPERARRACGLAQPSDRPALTDGERDEPDRERRRTGCREVVIADPGRLTRACHGVADPGELREADHVEHREPADERPEHEPERVGRAQEHGHGRGEQRVLEESGRRHEMRSERVRPVRDRADDDAHADPGQEREDGCEDDERRTQQSDPVARERNDRCHHEREHRQIRELERRIGPAELERDLRLVVHVQQEHGDRRDEKKRAEPLAIGRRPVAGRAQPCGKGPSTRALYWPS